MRPKLQIIARTIDSVGIQEAFRNKEILILDCFEIDHEMEIYKYWCEIELNGQKYRTWINGELIKF